MALCTSRIAACLAEKGFLVGRLSSVDAEYFLVFMERLLCLFVLVVVVVVVEVVIEEEEYTRHELVMKG